MNNDINLPEANFDHALDEYYGFLHKVVGDKGGTIALGQRLVTMNTITPYSIVKDKPLYNMFVLRAYADLVIRKGNSVGSGSPKTPPSDIIDSANSGDAWSWEYFRLAFPNLLQELKKYIQDPSVQSQISALDATWSGAYDAYMNELEKLEDQWDAYSKKNEILEEKSPAEYYRLKADWWRKRKDRIQRLYDKQFALLIEISDLELAHLDAQGLLLKDLKDNLSTGNQVKLPIRPELEDGVVSDPTSSPGDYDRRPALYPAGSQMFNDLLDESGDGDEQQQLERGYQINRKKTTTYSHDSDWSVSGSARKFFFLRANLSISEKQHFEEQIKKIGSIQVGFRAIQEVTIVRGRWYSGAFLKSSTFQKWLDSQPEFREKLRHIVTSVIVCRGLTVKLNFENDIHQNSWRDLKTRGSGGISIGGWNFGLNGRYKSRTDWDLKDVTKNSVTFADGPSVCRVIGLKVEDVLGESANLKTNFEVDSSIPVELLAELASAKISYGEFIDKVHQR